MDRLTAADFEALGLFDRAEPHAARKLELLEYLVGLGATPATWSSIATTCQGWPPSSRLAPARP